MGWPKFVAKLFLIAMLLSSGCVKYSFKGALPSYLKTIYIPLFNDNTSWPGLQEDLTNKVVDTFVQDNTLKVVSDEDAADLVLRGTIVSITDRKTAITQQEDVEETQVWVTVKIVCMNMHTQKPLWEGSVQNKGIVSGVGNLEERNTAIETAVDEIVQDILNKTIGAW